MSLPSVTADQDQFRCLICLHSLEAPVTIPCGHSYCINCIKGTWDWNDLTGIYNCPQCLMTFSPRPVLSRDYILDKKIKEMKRSRTEGTESSSSAGRKRKAFNSSGLRIDKICSVHCEPLDVYCRTDHSSICSKCVTEKHQHHVTVSVVAERKKKRKQLTVKRNRLQKKLREKEKKPLEIRMNLESFRASVWVAVEKTETISAELIQTIERRCSEVKEQIRKQEEAAVGEAKMLLQQTEQEIAEMKTMNSELEKILRTKNPTRFLQRWPLPCIPTEPDAPLNLAVDLQLPFKTMKAALSDLKQQLAGVCDAQVLRTSNTVDMPGSAPGPSLVPERQSDPEPSSRPEFLQYACPLTFDHDTANHELTLSAEGQEVTRGHKQCYVRLPERFISKSQVLCREALSGGRFYWEAEVEGSKAEVAVTYRGINRKGTGTSSSFGANSQSWSLDCINGVYSACHKNKGITIRATYSPRVGVYLDHMAGILSFYSISDTMTLLHRYQTTFHEGMYAGFWVGPGTTIKLCHLEQ